MFTYVSVCAVACISMCAYIYIYIYILHMSMCAYIYQGISKSPQSNQKWNDLSFINFYLI